MIPCSMASALEGAIIRHVSGGQRILGLKTYEQGRQPSEGAAKHVIWVTKSRRATGSSPIARSLRKASCW
jgi:hypothetical protein